MRNIAIIASILLVLLGSCADKGIYYSINGSGVASGDTLYLYGLDNRYEYMDTIFADNEGNFRYEIYADTVFPLSLIMPTGDALVLYAEPNLEATIFPDSMQQDKWCINGGELQQAYDSMSTCIEELPYNRRVEKIDSFVRRNPMSEVNIMLLRRYVVETAVPNNRDIREILNEFGGKLNDNNYVKYAQELIEKKRSASTVIYSTVPTFNYTGIDDTTKINNARYKDKFLVINFWASWDPLSCDHVKTMGKLSDAYSRDTLMMLNISLDHDTAHWREKILTDTIMGDNVCDLKMWNNILVKRYGVSSLPYSILVNTKLQNISYDIKPTEFKASVDSVIDVYKKEKEKEKKDKKKDKKRRKK